MAMNSSISWCDATWNPWMGCTKISSGCKYCYMHRILQKSGKDPNEVIVSTNQLNKPFFWLDSPSTIFVCSMSDFFIEEADYIRNEAWDIIKQNQRHTFLILTKRPERIKECLPDDWNSKNYSNVWLGVSVESQSELHRIHTLSKIPCELKWVSFEPLLGEVYLTQKELSVIQWAVIGGESGTKGKFRKTEKSWILSLMYQLRSSKTPIFFKQFGTWYHKNGFKLKDWKGEEYCSNFPEGFKVRQYPNLNTLNHE